jgi:hypothetical protein
MLKIDLATQSTRWLLRSLSPLWRDSIIVAFPGDGRLSSSGCQLACSTWQPTCHTKENRGGTARPPTFNKTETLFHRHNNSRDSFVVLNPSTLLMGFQFLYGQPREAPYIQSWSISKGFIPSSRFAALRGPNTATAFYVLVYMQRMIESRLFLGISIKDFIVTPYTGQNTVYHDIKTRIPQLRDLRMYTANSIQGFDSSFVMVDIVLGANMAGKSSFLDK